MRNIKRVIIAVRILKYWIPEHSIKDYGYICVIFQLGKKLTLGHSAMRFLKISRCRYNTDTILADGKVTIGDPILSVSIGKLR